MLLYKQNICRYARAITGLYTPGKPGSPHLTSVTGQSVNLEWTAPESDGGSRITGYVVIIDFPISSRTVYFKKFVRGTSTSCKLFPGRTYQFAVAAKNKVGHGEFSNYSPSFTFPGESRKGVPCVCYMLCEKYFCRYYFCMCEIAIVCPCSNVRNAVDTPVIGDIAS